MANNIQFGRIQSYWRLNSGGICVQLSEPRGPVNYGWELCLLSPLEIDFENEQDGLLHGERAFLLGVMAGMGL